MAIDELDNDKAEVNRQLQPAAGKDDVGNGVARAGIGRGIGHGFDIPGKKGRVS